jgi:cell filamentation protein, protein adenylyltransferase
MALSYQKLIQFDLLEDLEENLFSKAEEDNVHKFIDFFNVFQNIKSIDQFIKEVPSFPRSNKNIVRSELVRSIGSTLAIEGIVLREDEIEETLQESEESELQSSIERKKREVLNSRDVYEYICETVNRNEGDFVYTIDHICTIHKLFTKGIDYLGNKPGQFRNCGATFGDPRKPSLCDNYDSIYMAVKHFVEWLNKDCTRSWSSNIFAKALMTHYYLTEIHPFGDGNGRVSRAVEAMVLYVNGINDYCFWSLANFWSLNRNDYISHLGDIRRTCNPYDFIMWGARGYLQEVERIKSLVLKKVKQLMFFDYINYLLATNEGRPIKKRINKRISDVLQLLAHLGKIPLDKFRSAPAFKALYSNYSAPTPNRDQSRMLNLDLIRVTTIDEKHYIEPNYKIFNRLEYRV